MLGGVIEQGLGWQLGIPAAFGRPRACGRYDAGVVLDNFSILNNTSSLLDLRILESLYIFRHKPKLNNTQSCFPLEIVNS